MYDFLRQVRVNRNRPVGWPLGSYALHPATVTWLFVLHAAFCRRTWRCFSGLLQLPIPLGMDLSLTPGEHVLRRDVADGNVQADVVEMLDVALHQTPRIFQRQGRSRPDALPFERFVPSFDFSVRLGIVRRRF
jgi:hypothetical protein